MAYVLLLCRWRPCPTLLTRHHDVATLSQFVSLVILHVFIFYFLRNQSIWTPLESSTLSLCSRNFSSIIRRPSTSCNALDQDLPLSNVFEELQVISQPPFHHHSLFRRHSTSATTATTATSNLPPQGSVFYTAPRFTSERPCGAPIPKYSTTRTLVHCVSPTTQPHSTPVKPAWQRSRSCPHTNSHQMAASSKSAMHASQNSRHRFPQTLSIHPRRRPLLPSLQPNGDHRRL